MHPRVAEAIQQIDAALCNGDTFDEPEAHAELTRYVTDWAKRLAEPIPGSGEATYFCGCGWRGPVVLVDPPDTMWCPRCECLTAVPVPLEEKP